MAISLCKCVSTDHIGSPSIVCTMYTTGEGRGGLIRDFFGHLVMVLEGNRDKTAVRPVIRTIASVFEISPSNIRSTSQL